MRNVYDVQPGEVFWAASDIGWVVGHSYIVYAPLLRHDDRALRGQAGRHSGSRRVLARDRPSTPWRAVHGADRAARDQARRIPRPTLLAGRTLASLRTLFLAGERTDPDTCAGQARRSSRPVIDHWWQTETGWAIAAICRGVEPPPVKPGSPEPPCRATASTSSMPTAAQLPTGEQGAIAVRLPLPPGTLPTLWNADDAA